MTQRAKPHTSPWTDDTDDALIRLWENPENTTVEIAEILTHRFHRQFSKDMVIGRAHRLKAVGRLVGRPSPLRPRRPDIETVAPVPRAPKPKTLPTALPVRVAKRQPCCWITSSRKPWRYCDAPSLAGKVYCEEHYRLSVMPRKTNEEIRA